MKKSSKFTLECRRNSLIKQIIKMALEFKKKNNPEASRNKYYAKSMSSKPKCKLMIKH